MPGRSVLRGSLSRYSTPMRSCFSRRPSSLTREARRSLCAPGPGTVVLLLALLPAAALRTEAQPAPQAYLEELDASFYLAPIDPPLSEPVRDFMLPLGAIEKIRGVWSPRDSERVSGDRLAYTWRVEPGFTSAEAVLEIEARLAEDSGARIIFSCDARACGSSVQWANRIFRERLLYGTESSQLYRVYAVERGEQRYRLLFYASARSADRQYLRGELIRLADGGQ